MPVNWAVGDLKTRIRGGESVRRKYPPPVSLVTLKIIYMWIYRESKTMVPVGDTGQEGFIQSWDVGYFDLYAVGEESDHRNPIAGASEYRFQTIETYMTREGARIAVNYLNGGSGRVQGLS